MGKYIMLGIDVHDATLVIKTATGTGAPETRRVDNTAPCRRKFWRELRGRVKRLGGARVVMAYEASCQGFGLYDEATDEGFECHVLAPTAEALTRYLGHDVSLP